MAETKEINLEVKSNLGGSIAELRSLKKELRNAAAGSEEFKKIYGQIDDLEDKIKSAKKTSADWVDSLENSGGALGSLGAAINKVKVSTQTFGGALKATGIGLIVALVAGLAAAFSENESAMKKLQPVLNGISKIFQGIFRIVEPLFNILVDMAMNALPMVTNAFGAVYSAVSAVVESFGIIGKAIGQLMKGDFSEAWKTAKSSVTDFGKNYDASLKRFNDGTKELTKNEKEEAEKRRLQREKEAEAKRIADAKALADKKAADELYFKQIIENQKRKDDQAAGVLESLAAVQAIDDAAAAQKTQDEINEGIESGKRLQSQFDIKKKLSDAEKLLIEETKQARIQAAEATAATLNNVAQLLGESTVAGKAAAVASATISTFLSAQKAYESTVGIPIVGPFLAPINAALAIAGGLKSIKSILSVQVPGGGGGSMPAMPSAPSAPPAAPSFNVVGTSGVNQIAQGLGNQSPVQAYVIGSQVTTQQALDRNIVRTATLGG